MVCTLLYVVCCIKIMKEHFFLNYMYKNFKTPIEKICDQVLIQNMLPIIN